MVENPIDQNKINEPCLIPINGLIIIIKYSCELNFQEECHQTQPLDPIQKNSTQKQNQNVTQ